MISQLDKDSGRIADIYDVLEATRKHNITLLENIRNLKKDKRDLEKDLKSMKKERNKEIDERLQDKKNMTKTHEKELKDEQDKVDRVKVQARALEIEHSTLNERLKAELKEREKTQRQMKKDKSKH